MGSELPQRIVVVGGGVGGVSVCTELRRYGYGGHLTLVESGGLPYERPPLSKEYLRGNVDLAALQVQPCEWFTENGVDAVLHTEVVRVDSDGVELADGRWLAADAAVLALGGRARRLDVPGGELAVFVRTVSDADALRSRLVGGASALIVGGGLIGAEVAATAVELGAQVTLADPALPLISVVGEPVARWLHDVHRQRGIDVRAAGLQDIGAEENALRARLSDGSDVVVDVVVAGVGMVPNTGLAEAAELEVDGGVVVGSGQQASVAGLYAVGDCARRRTVDGRLLPRVEHWDEAVQSAKRAAASIMRAPAPADSAPWFWTDRHGLHVEVVGEPAAGEQVVRGVVGEPPFAVFSVAGGRLVGAVSVDDANAVRAARRIIDRRIAVTSADLADSAVDLRRLAKKKS